ncbi:MAG: formylglycine-generating enzyme family protein, partial [bacterium]|nr:formylglycine-generating enzyme family protein [bacterium]
WVQDFYGKEYYSKSAKSNPKGPDDGDFKVERGGSWASPKTTARVANRNYAKPDFGIWNIGIRCAK